MAGKHHHIQEYMKTWTFIILYYFEIIDLLQKILCIKFVCGGCVKSQILFS